MNKEYNDKNDVDMKIQFVFDSCCVVCTYQLYSPPISGIIHNIFCLLNNPFGTVSCCA